MSAFSTYLWGVVRTGAPQTLLQIVVSAIGFIVALGINQLLKRRTDRRTYMSMRLAILVEAQSNETVLNTSYKRYFGIGIIINEFDVSRCALLLASPIFMEFATPDEIRTLSRYIANLRLANGYRAAAQHLTFSPDEQSDRLLGWQSGIMSAWSANIDTVAKDIQSVILLESDKSKD
jgi:hypothetical protein